MKATYLDEKLRIIVKGEKSDLRDCIKIILGVTNGGTSGHRNQNLIDRLFSGQTFIIGHYKKEKVKVYDNRVIYGFLAEGASVEAQRAAENHYLVIKENIQKLTGENGYKIKGKNG
jgi:hypothetical protein